MAESIKIDVLQFPDNIRQVAGMYIGDANDCTNILREVVDNALDELSFVPSFNQVIIESTEDSMMVADWGRGMPINMHHQYTDLTSARVATSIINAGGKFTKTKVAAGQNGTGIKTTNALSELFVMMVKITDKNCKDSISEVTPESVGKYYVLRYEYGHYISELVMTPEEIGSTYCTIPKDASTVVYFKPDYSLIKNRTYKLPIWNFMYKAFEMKEYHDRKISILCNGEEMVREIPKNPFVIKHRFNKLVKAKQNQHIDLWFSFNISSDLRSKTYKGSVNSLVVNNGIHVEKMAVAAIRKAISIMTGCENTFKLEQGLIVRSIVNAIKVDFKSQSKEYCNVIDGWEDKLIDEVVPKVVKILEPHKKLVQDYVNRINELDSTYKRLKDKKYIQDKIKLAGKTKKVVTPPKTLFQASGKKGQLPELFITEGRSAQSTMTQARDPQLHAIYALRGRPLNASNLTLRQTVQNKEMAMLFNIIGMGVNGHCDVKNRVYSKIILVSDSDAYGMLINSSMLINLATHASFLLNLGMIYIAEAPAYKQNGRFYYASDGYKGLDKTKPYDLFKGLGSMDAEEADQVFFNPKTRRLTQITKEGLGKAKHYLSRGAWMRRELAHKNGHVIEGIYNPNESEDNDQ